MKKKTTSLQKQQLYFSNCNCDIAIHNSCLKNWIYHNKSCPLCRNYIVQYNIVEHDIVENNDIMIFKFYCSPWGINFYLFTKKISINMFKFLFIISVFYLMIEIYLTTAKSRYIQYEPTHVL